MEEQSWWNRLKRFVVSVAQKTIEDQVFFRGTSLAFTTAMALIPVTIVIFSLGGFNRFTQRMIDALGHFLMPDSSDEILQTLNTFTTNANSLGAWGSVIFVITAIMLLNAIENHLNSIFRVPPLHGFLGRARLYLTTLALTAFIFASGFGPLSGILDMWTRFPVASQRILGMVLSFLGTTGGMMALFAILSAAKIRFHSALTGGLIGSLGFQAAKFLFALWMQKSVRHSVIYGSLVFIPKFLLWLATAWIVFLIAAEITYALQIQAGKDRSSLEETPAGEMEAGWNIFLAISSAFQQGKKPPGTRKLAARLRLGENRVAPLVRKLHNAGLIRPVNGHPAGYVPSTSPENITATEVLAVISGGDQCSSPLIRGCIYPEQGNHTVQSFLSEFENQNT